MALRAKEKIRALLVEEKYSDLLDLAGKEGSKVLQSLMSLLYDSEELVRWRTVSAFGKLALVEPELIQRVVSRLAWTLNDEAGAINWGAPVVICEIGSVNFPIVKEVVNIVLHYLNDTETCRPPNRNLDILTAVLWGVGRLGKEQPQILQNVVYFVISFLDDENIEVKGLALWGLLGFIQVVDAKAYPKLLDYLIKIDNDRSKVAIYEQGQFKDFEIMTMAKQAIAFINKV